MRLEQALEVAGMTKYRLAKLTGISQVQIGRLASGERDATPDAVQAIAPHLGLSVEEMQAWADADRLGDQGIERLERYVLQQEGRVIPPQVARLIEMYQGMSPEIQAKALKLLEEMVERDVTRQDGQT